MDSTVTIDILWACFKSDGGLVSFRKFFDSIYAPLCRYAYLIVKDRMDAEEIVLDLFIYLWKNREKINIESSVGSYLFRSVRNRAINFLRSRPGPGVPIDDIESWLSVPDSLADVDAEDISYLVREAICSLPPKCKEVFSRSRSGGLSNEQIASEMGISVKTVEAHMTRALKTLRIKLKKMYFFFFML